MLDLAGGRGSGLSLLAATREPDAILAEGYYAGSYLRKGRVFTDPSTGRAYRLPSGLRAGLRVVGAGLDSYKLDKPIVLPEVPPSPSQATPSR